ncbi:hypothetical protein OSB04_028803 [Centaurea solstitialis]|uniref:Integrase catalytic domain-containing protein n=1 Tax=Centaurea solstitialis TaxID=347529 RepID=A0AA38W0Z7_9ASTR|nr:hypothetical protein OSB04_028803 [Centaurea solstitialis]
MTRRMKFQTTTSARSQSLCEHMSLMVKTLKGYKSNTTELLRQVTELLQQVIEPLWYKLLLKNIQSSAIILWLGKKKSSILATFIKLRGRLLAQSGTENSKKAFQGIISKKMDGDEHAHINNPQDVENIMDEDLFLEDKIRCDKTGHDITKQACPMLGRHLCGSDASEEIILFIRKMEKVNNLSVRSIRNDHGTEFNNSSLETFFDEKGISQNFSSVRTPQQNGVAERQNRILVEAA